MADRFAVGDIIRMKKPHPCGTYEWEILRVGADFRLKCTDADIRLWCRGNWWKKTQEKLEKKLETVNCLCYDMYSWHTR